MDLETLFGSNIKLTENGDVAFKMPSTNNFINILFLTEYFQNHLSQVPSIGEDEKAQLFAMMIRDPRFGLGRRDLGRYLMGMTKCSIGQIMKAGRADDLLFTCTNSFSTKDLLDYLKAEIEKGNELVKKWMPRYSSKNVEIARKIAKDWGMNKQQYGKFIKCNTTEQKLSRKNFDEIAFEHTPSLAMLKYAKCFNTRPELKERYHQYLEDVKAGKKDLKVATTSVYDIYRNRAVIDADIFFEKIEKISIDCIPIVDTSGSMYDSNDSIGKALAIGHYLSKCSSTFKDKVIAFSSHPTMITLGEDTKALRRGWYTSDIDKTRSLYEKEISSMITGDCTNTDFGAVMNLLSTVDSGVMPKWLVVLSDMEFDAGSYTSKVSTMALFKKRGYTTRIIWWNLNSRNTTAPEMDVDGNIFISGYNPMLLKYLKAGFNQEMFLENLLDEYKKNIEK